VGRGRRMKEARLTLFNKRRVDFCLYAVENVVEVLSLIMVILKNYDDKILNTFIALQTNPSFYIPSH
jgi:hypothetical protein